MRVVAGYLLETNISGQTGFIWATEKEPRIGEQFLVPQSLNDFLKIHTKVATVIDYEMRGIRWALHLSAVVENPCSIEDMREISS